MFLGAAVPIWGPITPGNRRGSGRTCRAIRTTMRAPRAAQEHRPRGPQRQRRGRGRGRDGGAVHRDHAAGPRLLRARHGGAPRRGGEDRHRARHRAARIRRDDRADAGLQLRRDLHASALHRPRPGRQPRFLAQLRVGTHFWNMAQRDAGDRRGSGGSTRSMHRAGGDARPGAPARAVQRRAADPGREPAGAVLRGAAHVRRAQRAALRRRAVSDAPAMCCGARTR